MSTVPLKARLTAIMKSWPIPINPGCEHGLKQLIDQAVTNMQAAGLYSQVQKLNEAESNFPKTIVGNDFGGRQTRLQRTARTNACRCIDPYMSFISVLLRFLWMINAKRRSRARPIQQSN
jgi:hypothetical protein